jgi:hypothetical protein
MVVNFRTRGFSRGARKLARTPTIIKKKKKKKRNGIDIGLSIIFIGLKESLQRQPNVSS